MKTLILGGLAVALALTACSPKTGSTASAKTESGMPAKPAKSYAGSWDVTIEGTPMGTVTGVMTIEDTGGQLSGNIVSNGQTFKLSGTQAADGTLSTSFYYPEAQTNIDIELTGQPSADALSGQTMGQFKTTAKRKM